jgi:RNA polymerase sigma-70 factor (ECF subfamily)
MWLIPKIWYRILYKLITSDKNFVSTEHEKAWSIRVATNLCLNKLKHWWNKNADIQDFENYYGYEEKPNDDILALVMSLPEKYKTPIYLYYYEGYDSSEIAKILKKPQSTIRNHLSEARKALKEIIGEDR